MATITKLPSGSWRVQIRRKGERKLNKVLPSKSLAQQWARSIESQIDHGTFLDRTEAESTSLGELIDRYQVEVSPTKKCYESEIRRLRLLKRELVMVNKNRTPTQPHFSNNPVRIEAGIGSHRSSGYGGHCRRPNNPADFALQPLWFGRIRIRVAHVSNCGKNVP